MSPAVARFLRSQRVGHLATADRAGRPHVVPICYALAGPVLYSVLDRKPKRVAARELRRVRNIRQNPRVAVVVDVYAEDWSRLGFVLLEGAARLVASGAEHARALRLLRRRYPQYRTMDLRGAPVIAVDIGRATSWGRLAPAGR